MSSLIVGSRMVTAEVFALTTKVDTHAAARTPPAAARSVALASAHIKARPALAAAGVWSPKKR